MGNGGLRSAVAARRAFIALLATHRPRQAVRVSAET